MNTVFHLNQPKIALLAVGISLTALFLCICACVNSPVSWSPDSSKIAILVLPAEDDDQLAIFTYDLNTGRHNLIDKAEAEKKSILSAPSWSPNGKWIAYYKTDSSGTGEELFNEDKSYLDKIQHDVKHVFDANNTPESFDMKLMLATPDGKEQKVLKNLKSLGGKEHQKALIYMPPVWSENSKRIYYTRMPSSDLIYIASIDIASGSTIAHISSNTLVPILSPDGKKFAGLIPEQDGMKVVITNIDGKETNSFIVNMVKNGLINDLSRPILWMPDSKHILFLTEKDLMALDVNTGNTEKLKDIDLLQIEESLWTDSSTKGFFVKLSPKGDKMYYLIPRKSADPNEKDSVWFESMTIKTKQITPIFELSQISEFDIGMFSISPDCKTVLLRTIVEEDNQKNKSVIFVWDGKSQKVIETDPWVEEAFKEK